jgi:predicted nucleic acid-binding protein
VIIVDVNVVAYYFIDGEKTAAARDLMRHDPDWRVPSLWRHEYLNVLATYARRGGATATQARTLWRRALELLGPREEAIDPEAALALAIDHPISAYDAQYVALGQRLGARFVTEDQRLLRAFPGIACTMRSLIDERGPA